MAPNRSLKQARELRGWSQAKVAREIGTDATTVSRWERGLFSPTPYFRERLCAIFEKNTVELGLLETTDQPRGCEQSDAPFLPPSATVPLFQWYEEQPEDRLYLEQVLLPALPAWSDSTDIFAYILRSAAHDFQAHMLWKAAYVQALCGQSSEARRLGEASLRAFERLGHVNAQAVREWLNHELFETVCSCPGAAALVPLSASAGPRKFKTFVREQGTRIALLVIGSFWFLFSLNFTLVK